MTLYAVRLTSTELARTVERYVEADSAPIAENIAFDNAYERGEWWSDISAHQSLFPWPPADEEQIR